MYLFNGDFVDRGEWGPEAGTAEQRRPLRGWDRRPPTSTTRCAQVLAL